MLEQIVFQYLKYLKVPVSRSYCKKLIASHPDYPSLLSIADTLERLGIAHQAARVAPTILRRFPSRTSSTSTGMEVNW